VALVGLAQSVSEDLPPPADARFERSVLAMGFDRPSELEVAPDGRVFVLELPGRVSLYLPRTGELVTALELPVFAEQENGLLGIALDPDFARNGWVYLLHSPLDWSGQHLSRFTCTGDRIDPASAKLLFSIPEQREQCCHHAGSIEFGPDGTLFVATGDNTNPFESDGFAPIDGREGRAAWDARRGSANTQSLSGKILRIRPIDEGPSGGYEIPAGNLFPPDGSLGRPEIYVMGCRNPWRISVDPVSGALYWGDVGPDASEDGARGPRGYDEIDRALGPGNFGWPLFIADNRPYAAFDFASNELGAPFDPAAPRNDSPSNDGASILPPAQPAWIHYPYAASPEFPTFGSGSRTACAGPVYAFDPELDSPTKFPAWFDGALLVYEWSRHWVQVVHLDADGRPARITLLPGGFDFVRPTDLDFGPDGALYVLEYGSTWDANADSRLSRIDHFAGNRPPRARARAENDVGAAPLEVLLDAGESSDRDGDLLSFRWRLSPDGPVLSEAERASVLFREPGVFVVELEVSDPSGASTRATLPVRVGNSAPRVRFEAPLDGTFFDPGAPVAWTVRVDDEEDGSSEEDLGAEDRAWWWENVFVASSFHAGPPPGEAGADPPGLARMKLSDCFHCHALESRIVGPSFLEIAERRRAEPGALEAAMRRVREGSTGVFGTSAMLPHPSLLPEELHSMVAFVLALRPESAASEVRAGLAGAATLPPDARSGTLVLQATYADTGGGPVGSITGEDRIRLRTRRVEAEHSSTRVGTAILESESASGGRFVGSVDDGHLLRFARVRLDGIERVRVGVSSAGGGGAIEFRADAPEGELLARIEVVPNGHWEDWFELEAPIRDPDRALDLVVRFANPAVPSGLLNLDWIEFSPPQEPSASTPLPPAPR
jgi:cytochrome c